MSRKRIFSQAVEDSSDRSAIPISKSKPDLVDGIPISGEDYLLLVRQQANKCAKTAVAPPPKEIKKVQLPSHFQFFNNSSTTDEKDQACEVWKQGVIQPFKSYQKFMQTNKKMANKKEIKTIEEGKQLVYPESKSADHANLASSLSQIVSIEAQFEFVNKVLKWSILDLDRFISTLKARISAEEAYVLALSKITKNNNTSYNNNSSSNSNTSNTSIINSNNSSLSTIPIHPTTTNHSIATDNHYFGDYTTLFEKTTYHYEFSIEKKIQGRKEFLNCLKYQTELLENHEQRRKTNKGYYQEYVSLQQQVLISSHDERFSIPSSPDPSFLSPSNNDEQPAGRLSSDSVRTVESISSHSKKNGMSGLITQMRSQLANAAAAGDPSKLTARLARLKKEVYDTDQEYRQGIRTLESLRKIQIDTAAHAIRHVEALLLGKSDAVRAVVLTISKQEQETLATEANLVKDTLEVLDQMDAKKDLERFLMEYEKLGFIKPRTICYENYYYGKCKDLLFGCHLNDYSSEHNRTVPLVVTKCIQQVELLGGLEKEGIYRVSGRQTNIDLLKSEFEKDEELVELVDSKYDVFTVASVLKLFLRELKKPLLDLSTNERATYSKLEDFEDRKRVLEKSIDSLSKAEKDTLKTLIIHLAKVEARSDINKMNIKNLSLMFAPAIFHDHTQADNTRDWYALKILQDLVQNYQTLNCFQR
ncbi:hypothetical protein G6F38_001630 [Rhizopus arrhizus]|nr:hypothetical protein G6F38_001630 [Rhizopus arrhizus]